MSTARPNWVGSELRFSSQRRSSLSPPSLGHTSQDQRRSRSTCRSIAAMLLGAWSLLGWVAPVTAQRVPLLINGQATDDFPAVGIVGQQDVGGFCTGTLISPRHVLTAAHCAEHLLDLGPADSGQFQLDGQTYQTIQVHILESYDRERLTDDVAVLVLDRPVDGVQPVPLATESPAVGQFVTLVGFGGQGTPEEGSDGSFGQKTTGTAQIESVSEFELSWEYRDPELSNPAPGDSGGPLFIGSGGELRVVGIVSSGTTDDAALGDIAYAMRVDAYLPFIESILAIAPEQPTPDDEPPAEPAPGNPADPAEQDGPTNPPADTPVDETPPPATEPPSSPDVEGEPETAEPQSCGPIWQLLSFYRPHFHRWSSKWTNLWGFSVSPGNRWRANWRGRSTSPASIAGRSSVVHASRRSSPRRHAQRPVGSYFDRPQSSRAHSAAHSPTPRRNVRRS